MKARPCKHSFLRQPPATPILTPHGKRLPETNAFLQTDWRNCVTDMSQAERRKSDLMRCLCDLLSGFTLVDSSALNESCAPE